MATRFPTDCEGFHRRDFLKIGAGGALGLSLADLLRLEAQAAKKTGGDPTKRRSDAVIMVWLAGGPSSIDMWDLKPGAPEGIRGEFKPVATSAPGIEISEHLPKMGKVIDKATIVRSLYHAIPSHGPATVWMTTGNKPTPALQYPALGSLTAKLMPGSAGVPKFVSFGEIRGGQAGLSGYLGSAYNPFIIDGVGGGKGGGGGALRVRGVPQGLRRHIPPGRSFL